MIECIRSAEFHILQVKKGQRWLWSGFDAAIVEILEDKDIGNMVDVKGKCVQKISPYAIPVGGVTDYFFRDNQQYWSLLKGQEASHD